MFNAYRVGITIALTSNASTVLGTMARHFAATEAAAQRLRMAVRDITLIAGSGVLFGGIGYAGLRIVNDMVKPATAYAHQLNIMNMAGLKQREIAEAVGLAWKNTSDVVATTATGNLRMLLDLRNVLGSMSEASMALPIVSKIQAVMASSSESGVRKVAADNFAFSMAKALDIIGAAGDPTKFARMAGEMAQVITAFQGRVTPQMFQSVFAYARQAKFGLSEDFIKGIMPTLVLEYASGSNSQGGGSRGVGPMLGSFAALTLQGYINKKAMPELVALGLLDPRSVLRTTTVGTTAGPLRGAALAASNPFLWVQQVLMPAMQARFGGHATREQVTQEIQEIARGNRLAAQLMLEFALKQQNFLRDQKIIQGAMPYGQAYQQAMRNDPDFAYAALGAQWQNLKTAFGIAVIPILVPAIMSLTGALNNFARWAQEHPDMAGALTKGFIMLSAALAFAGVVLTLTAAFRAMRLVLTIGGLVPALANLTGVGPALLTIAGAGGAVTVLLGIGAALGVIAAGKATQGIDEWMFKQMGVAPPTGYNWIDAPFGGRMPIPYWGNKGGGASAGAFAGTQTSVERPDAKSFAAEVRAALHGASVYLNGMDIGKLLFGGGSPPADSANIDTRLAPLYPTGAW